MKLSIWTLVLANVVNAQQGTQQDEDALYARAIKLMSEGLLIDTHIDLPQIIRGLGKYRIPFIIPIVLNRI
jgi:hypothetical protein